MSNIRGYAPWEPKPGTLVYIDQIETILTQQAEYLPLSIRQIFYLGVAAYAWPKTDRFYKNQLVSYIGRARRAEMISFDDIRDDGTTEERPVLWSSEDSFRATVKHWVSNFRLDPMLTQDRDVMVWTEGKGLVPMVAGFVEPYGVAVLSSGGFDSLTFKNDIASRYADRTALVLHLGDYDPSGEVTHTHPSDSLRWVAYALSPARRSPPAKEPNE